MSDMVQIRKLRAASLCNTIQSAAWELSQRIGAPYQDEMPNLDWRDEAALRAAALDIVRVLEHDMELSKRIEAA